MNIIYKACIGSMFILITIIFISYIYNLKFSFVNNLSFTFEEFSQTTEIDKSFLYLPDTK